MVDVCQYSNFITKEVQNHSSNIDTAVLSTLMRLVFGLFTMV